MISEFVISAVEKVREFMNKQGVKYLLVNSTNKYLEEYYLKDPSKLKMAKSLLYKELMLTLPITLEESEGLYVAKDICEYIEEAFNRNVCIKKEDLN